MNNVLELIKPKHSKIKSDDVSRNFVKDWYLPIIFALLFALLIILWFSPFPYKTLMGDDLGLVVSALGAGNPGSGYASHFWNSFSQTIQFKYRPVFTVAFFFESHLLGAEYRPYFNANLFFQWINVLFVVYLAWHLSNRRHWVAFAMGLMMIISRFTYHYVFPLWGFMEEIALFFLLAIIYTLRRAYIIKRPLTLLWPLAFFFLISFTHERFMVLFGFVSLAILLAPMSFKRWYYRLGWAAGPGLILVINYLIKTVLIKVSFFAGAGTTESGTAQGAAINLNQFFSQIYDGLLNLIGFNTGPNYLVGKNMGQIGLIGYLLGFSLLVPLGLLFLLYIFQQLFESHGKRFAIKSLNFNYRLFGYQLANLPANPVFIQVRNFFLFLVLLGSLLVSASVSTRIDFRWLYSVFIVFIIGIAYLSGHLIRRTWLSNMLIALIVIASLGVDTFYRQYNSNIYFFGSLKTADSAKARVIDAYGPELKQSDIYIITNGLISVTEWPFLDNYFFRLYTANPDLKVNYVDSLAAIPHNPVRLDRTLVFNITNQGQIEDLTLKIRPYLQTQVNSRDKIDFDFVTAFSQGEINDKRTVSTPTKQGVFLESWPGILAQIKSITVLSTFTYSYSNITIKKGDYLAFDAAVPIAGGDGVQAYLAIVANGKTQPEIFKADLPPAEENFKLSWKSYQVPLDAYVGQQITLVFGAKSPSGNMDADWVAFGNVYLVAKAEN